MDDVQIITFIQSCTIVYACLAYSYAIGKIVPPGKLRSLFISPLVAIFLLLPLRLTSVTLCSATALFITWVATFKLALFSFGKGPLASHYQSITFSRFLAVGSLPIVLTEKSKAKVEFDDDPLMKGSVFALKILVFALLNKLKLSARFDNEAQLHPAITVFFIYGVHMALSFEFFAFVCRASAESLLGLKLQPQFNEPCLSTSVQNFWGQRWNLAVGSILRATIYDPVRAVLSTHVGSQHARRLAVLATFGTSALMHEIIFYYLSRRPRFTWHMTCFFLLHAVTVVVEMDMKMRFRQKWRPPRLVSILFTSTFMAVTGFWGFSAKLNECNIGNLQAAEDQLAASFEPFPYSLTSFALVFIQGCVK